MPLSEPTREALAGARWFGGKGGSIAAVEELDRLTLDRGALRVLSVAAEDGSEQRYLWLDGEVGEQLVELVAASGERGGFSFRPGAALARLLPAGGDQRGERPIGHDQSNTSLVVGERVVVKLYRRLEAGAHPEIELGEHLTRRGLRSVPAFAGSVAWHDHPVALLQAYVHDAEQGWEWAGAMVESGDVRELARVGALTAEIHATLAELGSRPATPVELARWHTAALEQLEAAVELTGGDARELLSGRRGRIEQLLAGLGSQARPPAVQRVHGDLHIGQVLRAGGELVVVDLEGEPGRPLADRALPGSPLRDVAAMLRSFDHLARYVQHERVPGLPVEGWIEDARAAYLGAYGDVDGDLLRAFEVEKECYEFTYAAAYLPEWTYTAVAGMRSLLGEAG